MYCGSGGVYLSNNKLFEMHLPNIEEECERDLIKLNQFPQDDGVCAQQHHFVEGCEDKIHDE